MAESIISIFAIVLSFISIYLTVDTNRKQNQLYVFSEYTKRHQEIILNLYRDPSNKEAYHRLYFDLCSEEYYLHSKKLISDDIWERWVYGMKLNMKNDLFRGGWIRDEVYYDKDPEFQKFFEKIIEDSKKNKY